MKQEQISQAIARIAQLLVLCALFGSLAMLMGCTTALRAPASPQETLALNYKTIETLASSTANSVRVGSVTPDKARNMVKILEQAYSINKMAEDAFAAGNVADGQGYLTTTSQILTQVEVLLK